MSARKSNLTPEQRVAQATKASRAAARVRRTTKLAKLIETAPPLEPEQRDRIASLLFAQPTLTEHKAAS